MPRSLPHARFPDRLGQRSSRLWRTVGASCLGFAVLTTALAPADAYQVDIIDSEIDDGTFAGSIGISGNFRVDPSVFDSRVSGSMVVFIDVAGPANMVVSNGVVSGDWSFAGPGGLDGEFTAQGFTVGLKGRGSYDATGTFTGTSESARVTGTINSTSTGEVIVPGPVAAFNPGPQTSSSSDPIDEVLTDVLAGCRQVVARFDRRLSAQIEEQIPGATADFQGVVAVYDDVSDDEQKDELDRIVKGAAALQTGSGIPIADLGTALELLRSVERLQDEISANSDCPQSKQFFNALTNVARQVADRAIDALAAEAAESPETADAQISIALRKIVDLLLATGADGSGAPAPAGTLAKAEAMAHAAWDRSIAADPIDFDTLSRLSALAVQMGWEFDNGFVNAADVLITLGEPS